MCDLEKYKREICDIGDRIYRRGFVAANDGNITYRIEDNKVLCTPTMHCKGFLKPSDICVIDFTGKQIAGEKKRSSEALLHLEIMKQRPDVRSVVHCHPPHATAFAVAREPIPQGILPEVELFLGNVGFAPYATPGTQALADSITPFIDKTNVIVLANHGTVSFGENVERAYWQTETLDSYCRILLLTMPLGRIQYLSRDECRELLSMKADWGFSDARLNEEFAGCDILANDVFRHTWKNSGVAPKAFQLPTSISNSEQRTGYVSLDECDIEAIVRKVTASVMSELLAKA